MPFDDDTRTALEVARREGRALTETERAIVGAEALTPFEAIERSRQADARADHNPGARDPMVINLGPQHPSTHGVMRLITELDGEVIRDLHPVIGYLHTGIEKQCENKTYWQAITLVTRMDYLASYFNIAAYTMAVERLLDLEVPERAQYIRVVMMEINRISSHLVWLGTSGLELGAMSMMFYSYREREKALDLGEMIGGERMNTRYFQVGGCADDMPAGFEQRVRSFIGGLPQAIDSWEDLLTNNPIWYDRMRNVGVLPADELINLGVTGPALRAAGVDLDLRKATPYSGYEHFDFKVPLGANGDAYDRYNLRLAELRESIKIIEQALDGMPEGRHIADDRKVVLPPRNELATSMEALIHHFKLVTEGFPVPAGEAYVAVESPRGELGCYVVADGSPKPHRVHMRDPSFVNLQALRPMARGAYLADLITIIGSLDNVMGGVDR
ncbi:MAG TPA: NADH dehydrogenase (quinone) subunit D [Miltoncostaeaceae bacterium]|nr:NADH dehydrogenase (quinone) subunit D [Miltoncostaeaceae bacterium]